MTRDALLRWVAKPVVFGAALTPVALLVAGAVRDELGANPIETMTHTTGDWALRFLLLTLAMTPLRRLTGWPQWIRFRRMLGLFAFFYASLHLTIYLWLDQQFDLAAIAEDIFDRPYITVGFTAWLLLVPLAATSFRAAMRRLGKRWVKLHRLVYAIGVLGVLHFLWLVKADLLEPLIYTVILTVLLAVRLPTRGGGAGVRGRLATLFGSAIGSRDPSEARR